MLALAGVLLAGCTTSSTAAIVTPHATVSPSPSPTSEITALPSTSPTPGDLPVSAVSFSCRLPVMVENSSSNELLFSGGFLALPGATYAPDSRGGVVGTGSLTTSASPELKGSPDAGLPSYDAAAQRWVPVGAGQMSPDGTAYAYGLTNANPAAIHVVSVSSATDKVFTISGAGFVAGLAARVESFDGTNVDFAGQAPDGYPARTWRLNIGTGKIVSTSQEQYVLAIRSGSVWIGYMDPHDPSPPQAPSTLPLFDSLVQVDLATGARTTWFYRPAESVFLLAIDDAGRPIVSANPGPDYLGPGGEIRRLDEPLSGGEDNGDLVYSGGLSFSGVQPDGDRIWFGSDRGIYLYTASGGLQKVFAFKRANESVFPAGFCR